MKEHVSPKQLARALHVSESSVKRWCDQGKITAVRTAGGHRRIQMTEVVDFLRIGRHELVRPEVLGLPPASGRAQRSFEQAQQQLRESLLAGDEEQCRRIVFDLHLEDRPLVRILDEVIAKSLQGIGHAWEIGEAEVYQERRSCEICLRIVHELRGLTAAPQPTTSLLAMGSAAESDPYSLPTAMIELVLKSIGWRAVSLGANLPFATLRAAVREHQPQLFWLSVSYMENEEAFIAGYRQLAEEAPRGTAIAVGGRALNEDLRKRMVYTTYCDNLQQLEHFAKVLLGAR